ncbi:MAG: penicillin-binding protein activator [Bdellovibrionales bacterium]
MRILTLSLVIITVLTACAPTQKRSQWEYKPQNVQTAQTAPKPINEPFESTLTENQDSEDLLQPYSEQAKIDTASLPPVRVALLVPLTGQHAKLGQSMLNAAQLALFDLGHVNYQIIPKDTQGNANNARIAATEAIDEGAELIIGPVFADAVRAVKPVASRARINVLAFSTDWTLAGGNTFIMGFLPFDQIERITQYAAEKNMTRIGVFAPDNSYGKVVTNAYRNLAPRYGLQTVRSSAFNPRSRNLAPDVETFTQSNATLADGSPAFDAVLMPVGGQNAITISNLLTQNGMPPSTVKRLGTGLMDDTGLAGEPGLSGAWFAAPSPNLRRAFEQKYTNIYGRKAPRLATLAYDATALSAILAKRGLESQGRPQFDKNAIMTPNGFFGIDGIFRFRPDGTAERGLAVLQFNRGNITVVDEAPTTFETTKF